MDNLTATEVAYKLQATENEQGRKDALAVDGVEVVRCKDCKLSGMYAFGHSLTEQLACLDIEEDGFIRMATSVEPDDFCSRGERKENDYL